MILKNVRENIFNKLLNEYSIGGLETREDSLFAGYTFYNIIRVAK